ncbi:MAG: MbtH family NRPS accessory protein [Halothiobacillaceae bacterium]
MKTRRFTRSLMRGLLAAVLAIGLAGCQSDESTRLFVLEAAQGEFTPTNDTQVFELTTRAHRPEVLWFEDRPGRQTGTETLDRLFGPLWSRYFENHPPSVGIAARTQDGEWLVKSAQVLSMTRRQDGGAVWRMRMDQSADFRPLDRVLIYLDNEGGLSPSGESHTFMQAAAEGSFVAHHDRRHVLELRAPLDMVMMLTITPDYQTSLIENTLFAEELWQGFADAPPNAAVSIADAQGGVTTTVVTLSEPDWDAESQRFRYRVQPLFGDLPDQSGPTFIYIDAWYDDGDDQRYGVVINHEELYSIWQVDRELPLGWQWVGFEGSKVECLDYIEENWTDMRPLSLREKMDAMEN